MFSHRDKLSIPERLCGVTRDISVEKKVVLEMNWVFLTILELIRCK